MKKIFDLKNYRNYLESYYVSEIDKNKYLERKKHVDEYSDESLVKIINDTIKFSLYILGKLKNKENSLSNYVCLKTEIRELDRRIETDLYGGWPTDILCNPVQFGDDFWVSICLLNQFFETKIKFVIEKKDQYNDEQKVGSIVCTPHIYIQLDNKKFDKIYDNNELKIEQTSKHQKIYKMCD